jgi:hypothetical protein
LQRIENWYRATSVSATAHDLGLDTIPHWHTTPVGVCKLLRRAANRQALYGTVRVVSSKSFLLRQKQIIKSSLDAQRREVLYVGRIELLALGALNGV